jgi:hypothetical protein
MSAGSAAVSAYLYSIVKNLRKYGIFASLSECQDGQLAVFDA